MMNRVLFVVVFCLSLLATGCIGQGEKYSVRIEPNWQESCDIQNIVKDIRYVELTVPDSVLIGDLRKLDVEEDNIVLSDGRSLFFFDNGGHYSSTLSRRGRGAGEYYDILDFAFTGEWTYIIDRNAGIFCYDANGTPLASRHLDFYPATIYPTETGLLATSAYQNAGNKFNMLDTETFELLSGYMPINPAEMTYRHLMGQNNFFRYDGKLLFHEPMNSMVGEITSDSLCCHADIDLMGRNAPSGFWGERFDNIMDLNSKANSAGYCFGFPEYGESHDRIVFTYRDGSRYCMCVYEKLSGKSVQFDSVSVCGVNLPIGELTWAFRDEQNVAFAFTVQYEDSHLSELETETLDESIIVGIGRL